MVNSPARAFLDPHAVLWSLAGDSRLGSQARGLIARSRRSDLIISDLVLPEISSLSAKGRIEDVDDVDVLLAKVAESFRVIPISPDIACLALQLDLPPRRFIRPHYHCNRENPRNPLGHPGSDSGSVVTLR